MLLIKIRTANWSTKICRYTLSNLVENRLRKLKIYICKVRAYTYISGPTTKKKLFFKFVFPYKVRLIKKNVFFVLKYANVFKDMFVYVLDV